jgi:hypothetical protein
MERQLSGPRPHRRNAGGNSQDYPRADAVAAGEADQRDDSGIGSTNTPMRDHSDMPRSRYTGHGRDTEGAFGEEDVFPDRP